jgi:hypothetical protein
MLMTTEGEVHSNKNGILTFFSQPTIGIVATIITIISLPLSIYFFVRSDRYPELCVYMSPAKAVVVDKTAISRFKVLLGGSEIKSDVTAAQVALWNQGKEPITRSNILQPIELRTSPSVPILEVSIRKTSRDIIHVDLDRSQMENGVVTVSWNILEQGDGGVLQFVYAGGASVNIEATGVVVGQRSIHKLQYSGKIQSVSEQIEGANKRYWFYWVLLAINGVLIFLSVIIFQSVKSGSRLKPLGWVLMVAQTVLLIIIISQLYRFNMPSSPFGF